MIDRGALAKEYFLKGYNCSQAVLLAFSDMTGLDETVAMKMASSFGGGMGRLREVCGTVSASLMVLGILYGYDAKAPTAGEDKPAHYARVQEYANRFRTECGSITQSIWNPKKKLRKMTNKSPPCVPILQRQHQEPLTIIKSVHALKLPQKPQIYWINISKNSTNNQKSLQ